MIRTVFLDVDNTLLDFHACARASMAEGLAERGVAFREEMFETFTRVNNGLWLALERGELTREELLWGMQAAERLLGIADEHSASVNAYGSLILDKLPQAERAVDRYHAAKAHFVQIVPQWEIFFEHMLVNHVFFKGATDPLHGFAALCAIYALLRLLGMSWMSDKSDTDALIDVCAAAFHLFDHTSFGQYAADMLRDLGAENGCGVLLAL